MVLTREQVDDLTKEDRVQVRIYSDPAIFEEELRRIFYTTWVYLGHVSEVPRPGDFLTQFIGLLPVVVSRDQQDTIHAFFNKATALDDGVLLKWEYGHEDFLKDMDAAKVRFGLIELAHVDSYRGFIFASMSQEGPSLLDHLGLAKRYLDEFCDKSPTGTVVVTGGIFKHTYIGNWKLQVESGNDSYHPDFLHRAAGLARARTGAQGRIGQRAGGAGGFLSATTRAIDLGNGHSIFESPAPLQSWEQLEQRYSKDYLDQLTDRLGPDRTFHILSTGWRMVIFPYIAFSSDHQIRIIRPLDVGHSEIRQYNVLGEELSDHVITQRIRAHEDFYGPAGYGGPDDLEMFSRMDEGYRAGSVHERAQWALLNRQYTKETRGPKGERIAHVSSEVHQRSLYYAWRALMKGDSHITITG